MFSGHVHEEQDNYLGGRILHPVNLLPPQKRNIHPTIPDQPYDDNFRTHHNLHDASSRNLGPDSLIVYAL